MNTERLEKILLSSVVVIGSVISINMAGEIYNSEIFSDVGKYNSRTDDHGFNKNIQSYTARVISIKKIPGRMFIDFKGTPKVEESWPDSALDENNSLPGNEIYEWKVYGCRNPDYLEIVVKKNNSIVTVYTTRKNEFEVNDIIYFDPESRANIFLLNRPVEKKQLKSIDDYLEFMQEKETFESSRLPAKFS